MLSIVTLRNQFLNLLNPFKNTKITYKYERTDYPMNCYVHTTSSENFCMKSENAIIIMLEDPEKFPQGCGAYEEVKEQYYEKVKAYF